MLYSYTDCNSSTLSSLDYNLYISDAQENPTAIENVFFGGTILNEEPSSGVFNLTYHWSFFGSGDVRGTPQMQCERHVFGLYAFFYHNSMISFVATFRTPTTFKGFSMLPLPAFITSAAPSPPIRQYEYFILFRSHGD